MSVQSFELPKFGETELNSDHIEELMASLGGVKTRVGCCHLK